MIAANRLGMRRGGLENMVSQSQSPQKSTTQYNIRPEYRRHYIPEYAQLNQYYKTPKKDPKKDPKYPDNTRIFV